MTHTKPTDTPSRIVQRLWNYCNVLRDDGVSYGDYLEQLTNLIFLKMAYEQTEKLGERRTIPKEYDWGSVSTLEGPDLEDHYFQILKVLGARQGLIGVIFRKAQNRIQDPAKLRRLIQLIDNETWLALGHDIKGQIYEGLLEKNAQDIKSGAGQYFTPRPVIQAIVDVIRPCPYEFIADPACGTGGFLLAAHDYIKRTFDTNTNPLSRAQRQHLKRNALHGWEIVDNTARLCVMNLYLHNIGDDEGDSPIQVIDSLQNGAGMNFDVVLTNPPFGNKSTVIIGEIEEEDEDENGKDNKKKNKKDPNLIQREGFWTTTSNKQLNFVQHVYTLLKQHGRAAVVVPDNVLFEGGAGETIRRNLMKNCDVHTLLRLPTGIFYAPGVKANVLFFDRKPGQEQAWTKSLWIYDLRTNLNFTLKKNPLQRADLDQFVRLYHPAKRHERQATWSPDNPDGRWREYSYEELTARDKANLDIFWLRDESLEDGANLPEPDVLAQQIVEELQAALEQFAAVANDLRSEA